MDFKNQRFPARLLSIGHFGFLGRHRSSLPTTLSGNSLWRDWPIRSRQDLRIGQKESADTISSGHACGKDPDNKASLQAAAPHLRCLHTRTLEKKSTPHEGHTESRTTDLARQAKPVSPCALRRCCESEPFEGHHVPQSLHKNSSISQSPSPTSTECTLSPASRRPAAACQGLSPAALAQALTKRRQAPGAARHDSSQAKMSTSGSGRLATLPGKTNARNLHDFTTASLHRAPPRDRKMPVTKDCGRAAALIAKTSRAAARATSGIGTLSWKYTAALDDGSSV